MANRSISSKRGRSSMPPWLRPRRTTGLWRSQWWARQVTSSMDNTQHASVTISQHKARAAAIFRRPTKAFEENLSKGFEFLYQLTLDGMIGSQGGVPLISGGKLIGPIGCSGAAGPQDLQTCMAGGNALK